MSNPEWPISPTFLSLRKNCREEDAQYNNDGIFYTDYIRGFLADLSHDERVQNALSLFQFVPESFLPNDPNAKNHEIITTDPKEGTVLLNDPLDEKIRTILSRKKTKIIRIDSGTFINNGRRCDCFRKCGEDNGKTNKQFCFQQDSIVGIFADDELNNLPHDSKVYLERLEKIIQDFDRKIKIEILPFEGEKRFYVHYTCKKSLFEEHIFPIYAQGHIIACLMLGQMARESFIENESNAFSENREDMLKENPQIFDYPIARIDENKWNTIAYAIFDRIQTFEKRLEDRIEHRNTRYVTEEFEKIEKDFREEVKSINIKRQNVFSIFSKYLNKAFTKIRDKFDKSPDGFIRMFAIPVDTGHNELVPIGWTGAEFKVGKDYYFDLNQLNGLDRIEDETEQKEWIQESASQKIKEAFNSHKDVFLPGWLAGKVVAYIVWKRHNNYVRNNNNDKTVELYKKTLKNFYSIALECYSYIRGARMELLLETTIQESAHESAHFILPALNVVENHLSAVPKESVKSDFDYNKYIDSFCRYKDEALESLNQLWGINSGASLIFSTDLKLRKEPVDVYYLLYKLKKVLLNRALDGHKMICYDQEKDYVTANIDVTYFNHALYNLLDNAIKYGHEGSYIYIKMDADKDKNILSVQVISYGIGIPKEEEERVYNLFERGTEASNITRGTGLGMYIVKKICEAHGGTVSHKSEELSRYNIPVLYNYKKIKRELSISEIIKWENEISWHSWLIKKEVVYNDDFIKYLDVFLNRINMPTYRNTFIVKIPLK